MILPNDILKKIHYRDIKKITASSLLVVWGRKGEMNR